MNSAGRSRLKVEALSLQGSGVKDERSVELVASGADQRLPRTDFACSSGLQVSFSADLFVLRLAGD